MSMHQQVSAKSASGLAALITGLFVSNVDAIAQNNSYSGAKDSTVTSEAEKEFNAKEVVIALRKQGYTMKLSTPIFAERVEFPYPKDFEVINEKRNGIQYLQESVLTGESGEQWTQMITVTGLKGVAASSGIKPFDFAKMMASEFKAACPTSYSATSFGMAKVADHDSFAAVISCGTVSKMGKTPYSETALIVVIKGTNDYYTLQWAERGSASQSAVKYDESKWEERFKNLTPIKLCPNVHSESSPFVICGPGS